ncbi:hypothetical protein BJV74DRAFT_884151 [Russula compacta]|nr:hypothetical protein BJV74DRAFT_884151 [Russula compacta]
MSPSGRKLSRPLMPIMTRSGCHSEMTIPMIDPDTCEDHRDNSGAGIVVSHPTPSPRTDNCVDEKLVELLPERESCASSSSSSSLVSRFMGRLGVSLHSLSSLSSRRSGLPDARKTYAKIKSRHASEEGSGTSNPPYSYGTTSSQHSFSSTLWYRPVRRRCHDKRNVTGKHNPNLLPHSSHATTMTNGHHDSNSGSNSSLGTHQSSLNIRVPFPSTSEESYPSPHSADAIAVLEAPLEKGEAQLFDGPVKYHGILEDQVQGISVGAYEGTNTSTSTTYARSPSRRRGLVPLKRRASALASSVLPTRCKFPTIFHKGRYPRYPVDDDNDSVEYDIPCLAYIACLW